MNNPELAPFIIYSLSLLAAIILVFINSYLSEQGKQLAIKDNIENLTTKVEGIKSELDLLTKTKFDLASNERSAIIEFHDNYYDWRNSILIVYPSVINEENYRTREEWLNPVRTKELLLNNSSAKLELFIPNQDLRRLKKDVIISCLKMQHHLEGAFREAGFNAMVFDLNKSIGTMEEQRKTIDNFYEKSTKANETFNSERIKYFTELVDFENKLEDFLRSSLFKVLNS